MTSTRKSISKGKRFSILTRDGFCCRYCGRNSTIVTLHVDHIIAVANGGTNDNENLVTSCQDCNLGKSAKPLQMVAPTQEDKDRIKRDRVELIESAKLAKDAAVASIEMEVELLDFWEACRGKKWIDRPTMSVLLFYMRKYGPRLSFEWMAKAIRQLPSGASDSRVGRYVSALRKAHDKGTL